MKTNLKKAVLILTAVAAMMLTMIPAMAAEVAITKASFPTAISLKVGETKTFEVTTAPANATNTTKITWSRTENGKFSTKVNGYGTFQKNGKSSVTLTGKAAGTGTLTVTIKTMDANKKVLKTFTVKSTVTVTDAVPITGVTLSKKSANLNVGKTLTLTSTVKPANTTASKTVTWKSSNTAIATVSNGKITAKKPGTVTITATAGNKSATCKITVKAPLTAISMSKTALSLEVATSGALTVSYTPANTTDSKTVTWTSSNTAVATVSGGKVTAKKAGTATITAKVGTKSATCKVTVKAATSGKFIAVNDCYTKLNSYRASSKLGNLKKDTTLENIAKTRAKEIVQNFSHTRPNGKSGLTLISGNVYKGENIAKGQKDCAAVMTAWYNSAGHKANMLNKNFTRVGIAGFEFNGTIYWVQIFAS